MADAAEQRMRNFNSQNLANTAWAFAMVDHMHERLFTAFVTAVKWHIRDFNSQEHAITAWAFATAGHRDEQLFTALARVGELHSHFGSSHFGSHVG